MAVFTIAAGQTLRMDNMVASVPTSVPRLIGNADGSIAYQWKNDNTDTVFYQAYTAAGVFTPPNSHPADGASVIHHPLGNLTVDLTFYDPAFGVVGTLAGTTWADVTLKEVITYVNVGGSEPLWLDYHYYTFEFEGSVLFSGNDTVTLGAGNDVFYDYGGALHAELGGGNDEAWLFESGQGVTDFKFVDAGEGNDIVYYQSGNGTILGGAGNDYIGTQGNNDGTWLFNGGAGRDTIYAVNDSRIQDDMGSGNDIYHGYFPSTSDLREAVLSYTGHRGVIVDLVNNSVSGGGHGVDYVKGIRQIEGTSGGDLMIGSEFNDDRGNQWGVRFWGNGGKDTIYGSGNEDQLYGGSHADVIIGDIGNDRLDGGGANDTLTGGSGADALIGGGAADVFVYLAASDSTVAFAGRDRIIGFQQGLDQIDLSAIDGLSFIGTSNFSASGQVRYAQANNTTSVWVNTIGHNNAEMRIDVAGILDLTSNDFIF